MKVVEKAILSTDLALYFRKKNVFEEIANTGEIDWQEDGKKDCKFFRNIIIGINCYTKKNDYRLCCLSLKLICTNVFLNGMRSIMWNANDSLRCQCHC